MLFHNLCKVSNGFGGTVFSYNDVGDMSEWGDKKMSAGNLPWMMPCNVFNYKFLQILFWMFICNNNSLLDLLGENREFLVY